MNATKFVVGLVLTGIGLGVASAGLEDEKQAAPPAPPAPPAPAPAPPALPAPGLN